ncbi:MAG: hypothetical protein D6816_04205 [Bacteroidetes bacterium]|nr:MAG: hypothetical protein D6816_04205 [Bacteroidota bacterium]
MESITFQYPAWYLLLCILLGAGYAALLYFKDKTFTEQYPNLPKWLALLRFLAVTLIAILLLQPLLKTLVEDVKKPAVVMALDQSESLAAVLKGDTLETFRNEWEAAKNRLSEKYEVEEYAFGEEPRQPVNFQFSDKVTDISRVITLVSDLHAGQNLGALVLATDGIYNQGSNPLYLANKLNAPVYTVGLGDTLIRKDLILKRVFHNEIAYLGDKFSVQVDVSARNCAGSNTNLNISKVDENGTSNLIQETVQIRNNDFFETREYVLEADKAGVQRYRVSLSAISGEASSSNNYREFYVEVLDARQKILIVGNSPHPDMSAIKQSLEENKNYEVTTEVIRNINKVNVAEYDFVILHNLPSRTNDGSAVLNIAEQRNIPTMFLVGTQTNLARFNQVQPVLSIQGNTTNPNDVQAAVNDGFNLFTIDEELRKQLPQFNPLVAPFGEFSLKGGASVLLNQRIGKVDTKFPLMAFGQEGERKFVVLAAEGLWRWRLFDFLQNQNHDIFDEVIGKAVQYATVKADKRRFRISVAKNIFNENEPVTFDAELYNESYELVNEPDVSLTIINEEGREFNYTFDKTTNGYTLEAGVFPVGNYRFNGRVNFNGQNLTYNGKFSVQPIQLELYETTADHGLLRRLAADHGGRFYTAGQLDALAEELLQKDMKPVVFATTRTRSVIHLKWIFFLLLGLLSMEWFLRRYHGGY